jgi:hypothetical protein
MANPMTNVFFKLEYTVEELWIPPELVLTFDYDGPHQVHVVLRSPSPDERAQGTPPSRAFCTASSVFQPNEKVREVFAKIAANQFIPKDVNAIHTWTEYSTPEGVRMRLPPLSTFSESFRSFIQTVQEELHNFSVRTVSVLRWRENNLGPHDPIGTRGLHWSLDGKFWHVAPNNITFRISVEGPSQIISDQLRMEVEQMVRTGHRAPLHHDVFREAWEQRSRNRRSALVIGMAAAELAMKHCIATLVPDAEWIATNLPTPPLVRMVREYLPRLPARCTLNGQVKSLPKDVLDSLEKGVSIRNRLSHAGDSHLSNEVMEDILGAVHDLLWLVDYYSGAQWAFYFLRPETRAALLTA